MDGIPINTADGYGDFQEIDPTAYKYVEVWKGANALQYGANSLGGAINFVIPTGRDPWPNGVSADMGAFGFKRLQANAGGANGPWDGFVTASTQRQTASGTTVSAAAPASAAMSAISSHRMPRRDSISTPMRFASASPAASPSNRP